MKNTIAKNILAYNDLQSTSDKMICDLLAKEIQQSLNTVENKVWHAHPVWFLEGNPVAGYSKQKPGIRLMFWSGADFSEPELNVVGKKFKDASIFYNDVTDIDVGALRRWLEKSKSIQWDYKNLVNNKGLLTKRQD